MSPDSLACAIYESIPLWLKIKDGQSIEKVLGDTKSVVHAKRAAVQSIIYAVSRKRALVEALLKKLAAKKPDPQVAAAIEIAFGILLEGQDKAYVVVDQTVKAVKENVKTQKASGFVNAILRRFEREKDKLIEQAMKDPQVRYNAPNWWIKRYEKVFGEKAKEIFALQAKHPPLTLRVNEARTTVGQVQKALTEAGIESRQVGEVALVVEKPVPVNEIPGFKEGLVSVQDAGSQLAAEILNAKDGMRVLDACAAPGGKTAHILERAKCDVLALEIDPQRAKRIHENLDRLGLKAEVKVADAADVKSWWDKKSFDRILLDAPCTASGIVRRHPDIPWSRREKDVSKLAQTQYRILQSLWPTLAKGGIILYAVCSVFPDEGPEQIRKFLESTKDASLVAFTDQGEAMISLQPTENDTKEGFLPSVHDGFFYALIEKKR